MQAGLCIIFFQHLSAGETAVPEADVRSLFGWNGFRITMSCFELERPGVGDDAASARLHIVDIRMVSHELAKTQCAERG